MILLNKCINLTNFFNSIGEGALLMLDYDGTLAPHVHERMDAFPYDGVVERIAAIVHKAITRVVIISGRRLVDLEHLTQQFPNVELWGSHGLERKEKRGAYSKSIIGSDILTALEETVKRCKEEISGGQIEIKPFSLALHWRGITDKKTLGQIQDLADEWEYHIPHPGLEIHSFDGGVELRPKGRNKGEVVKALLKEVKPDAAIAYLGDDVTDEEAFKELNGKGLKVLVRKELRTTLADLYLKPPEELLSFLEQWSRVG